MTQVKCSFEGCVEVVEASPNTIFVCKNHTPKVEKDIAFQDTQFDKELTPGYNIFSPGFQIINPNPPANELPIPEWAKSDEAIRVLLYRSFPKLDTNERQRFRASRWAMIIYLYYRMNYTYSQIAEEMGIKSGDVHNILNRINRVAAGKRANNTGKRQS